MLEGNGRNLEIVGADPGAICLQDTPDFRTASGGDIVEWQLEIGFEEAIELEVFQLRIPAAFGAVAQFVNHHRTERHLGNRGGPPAGDDPGFTCPEQGDTRVGVRQESHPRAGRASKSPWGGRISSGIEPAQRSK